MDLKDRLQIILKKNNLNASAFADKIKIQRSNLSHILSGRNKPSLDFLEKFIFNFPDEDVLWLITGFSSIRKNEGMESSNQKNKKLVTTNLSDHSFVNQVLLNNKTNTTKKILKIITFYEDNSFDEYHANSL